MLIPPRCHHLAHSRRRLSAIASMLALLAGAVLSHPSAAAELPTAQQLSDVDWLYQHYFGDVTDYAPRLAYDTELKMFANGFALLSARGEDLAPSFAAFDQSYAAARERALQQKARADPPLVLRGPPPPVRALRDPASVELQRQLLRIAEHYHLPYTLINTAQQWIFLGPEDDPAEPILHPNTSGSNWSWAWQWATLGPGDVLWSNGASMGKFVGHVALVETPAVRKWSNPTLIDANWVGVRRHDDLSRWGRDYTKVRAFTPRALPWDGAIARTPYGDCKYPGNIERSCSDTRTMARFDITQFAASKIGKPYNYDFSNPQNGERLYCTSLIWQAYITRGYNIISPQIVGLTAVVILPEYFLESTALVERPRS